MIEAAQILMARFHYQFEGQGIIGYEFYPGWMPVLAQACEAIDQVLGEDKRGFHWVQLKEKFGTGRFYYAFAKADRAPQRVDIIGAGRLQAFATHPMAEDGVEKAIFEIVREAEAATCSRCMVCGAPATVKSYGGWLGTLCEKHPPPQD
jgi:hypothetical protein